MVSDHSDPDDLTLVAGLDISHARTDAWNRLLMVADEFMAIPYRDDDCRWKPPQERPDGVVQVGYPIYSDRVQQACQVLAEVRAVTPAYPWMSHPPVLVPDDGTLPSAADAVRIATATVRGERFGDGTIATAAEQGILQVALASLAAWYRELKHRNIGTENSSND